MMDYQYIVLHRQELEIKLETEIAFLRRVVERLEHINSEIEKSMGMNRG